MDKNQLQEQLKVRGIEFDKRWGEAKLKLALEENIEKCAILKPEDRLEDMDEVVEKEEAQEEPVSEAVEKIREGAMIAVKMEQQRKALRQKKHGRVGKNRNLKFTKAVNIDNVDIYDDESGKWIRKYSKQDHGDKYEELADLFINSRRALM